MAHRQPLERNAFRYHDDSARVEWLWRFAIAGLFIFDSVVTAFWALAALLHANWLGTNHLPIGNYRFWGVALLALATLQVTTALLLVFSRNVGSVLGIGLATLSMLAQVSVLRAFPVDSIIGIAVNLLIVYVLAVSMHRG